jgi:xylulokinase
VAELRAKLGQREFYRLNPNILGTNYSLPKLRWIRDHQRALYDQTWKFLFWGDLVAFLLAGKPQTSRSYANRTLLFDIRRERWSEPLLALGGIAREKLPDIVADGAVVGTVAAAMAKELGLPAGVQVVAGGHDQGYNSLGAGIYQAGKAVCGIGSYECITPTYAGIPDDVDAMLAQGLNIEHHVIPGLYVSFIYNQAGMLVKWFRDTFAPGAEGAGLYDALAAEMPVAPTRLMTLPYFETTGSPEFVSDAAGVIAGLKTSHRRGDILKSIMESSTYYFVDSLAALKAMGMDTSEFVATGGGARSDPWLQIKADILGVPFVRPRITECTVLGAAMLAGLGTKRFASPAEAVARFVQRDRVFTPDPGRHAIYVEQVEKYRRLFPLLREYLRGL